MSEFKRFPIMKTINLGGDGDKILHTDGLPCNMKLISDMGIAVCQGMEGDVVYSDPAEEKRTYEVRGTFTPGGDMILMFPCGDHYNGKEDKVNSMYMFRSKDRGNTWEGPQEPFKIDYSQHGFIPLIPKGSKRIYGFGTQPIHEECHAKDGLAENAPIGYFYSDDDGYTWAGPVMIRPVEDPSFKGMSVMRMCETEKGTWLLGSHDAYWAEKPLKTYQYILRSQDQGKTWHLFPGERKNGWQCPGFGRMDEGRIISLGGEEALIMIRTPEGHIWAAWTEDGGETWSDPKATSLIHPDAPPMVYMLSDGNLVCFHHNRHHDKNYGGLDGTKMEIMADRSELWVSFSEDKGHTWSEPQLVLVNACEVNYDRPFFNHQCSYIDVISEGDKLHILVPHLWHRILHLTIREEDLRKAPKVGDLLKEK